MHTQISAIFLLLLKQPSGTPVTYTPTPPVGTDALLLETGDYILLETGDKILLE